MAAYSNKHLKNNEYLGNKCSQKSVVQKMIIPFDFQRKSVECGAVGAKCLFLWSGPKKDKKVEKRRVKGGCVESGSDRGGELARSKDTADPRNRGTSSYSPGVPFFSFGTPG
jgi:hypothetical protein